MCPKLELCSYSQFLWLLLYMGTFLLWISKTCKTKVTPRKLPTDSSYSRAWDTLNSNFSFIFNCHHRNLFLQVFWDPVGSGKLRLASKGSVQACALFPVSLSAGFCL